MVKVRDRCRGYSLLNHCKQIGKPSTAIFYFKRKDYKGEIIDNGYFRNKDSWICELRVNDKVYRSCNMRKKKCLLENIKNADSYIRSILLGTKI